MKGFSGENQAIAMARNGDIHAQRYLYDLYRSRWFMIRLRYMPVRQDAEDALQNGLIHIYTSLDQFNPELGAFGAWSSRIISNDCIQLIRKNHRTLAIQELEMGLQVPDAEEGVLDKLSREEIIRMISGLPPGYRTVFNMYVFDGFTHSDIAAILHISEGTSKSQLSKARKMLQHVLEVQL